jgi:hypothetical protein
MPLLQAAVLGLTALILAPGYFFYFDTTPKLVVLLAGAAACALAWTGTRPARPLSLAVLASAAWLLVASALSGNPALSFFGSTWRRFGAVAQLAVLLMAWMIAQNGPRGKAIVLRGIAAACAVAAAYGIAQYFGWDPLLPKAAYHIGEGAWTIVRPPGTVGYVSYFATLLLMGGFLSLAARQASACQTNPGNPRNLSGRPQGALWSLRPASWPTPQTSDPAPLALAAAAAQRRGQSEVTLLIEPWLSYICAALCFTAMALTGTRAALLGLAAGLAAAGFVRGFRISRGIVLAAILTVAAGAAFYFSPPGLELRSRARWFREDPWGGARPLLWRDSLRMGIERPLAGFGPEVFPATFPQFESKELARAYPDFAHESPHNIFLDALVSQGLPGLACLIALCAIGWLAAWRSRQAWLCAALTAGIVAQQFTVFTIPTALLFYATIALCVARQPAPVAVSPAWLPRLPAAFVAAAMLYLAVRYAAADRALELANRRLASGDTVQADTYYREYRRDRMPGASADLWYARSLLTLSQTGEPLHRLQMLWMAAAASLQATRNADDPFNAWYNAAQVSAARNDAAATESSLRRAIAASPNWFKPHWTLAQLLRMEGRTAEAQTEAAAAHDLDGGKHPEVAQTLAEIRALHR